MDSYEPWGIFSFYYVVIQEILSKATRSKFGYMSVKDQVEVGRFSHYTVLDQCTAFIQNCQRDSLPSALKNGAEANFPSKKMLPLLALNARHMRTSRTSKQPACATTDRARGAAVEE